MPWEKTGEYIRSGHRSPEDFDPDSARTIDISEREGIKAIVACPRGQYSEGRCRVGTEVQSYLFSLEKGWTMERAKAWFKDHEGMDSARRMGFDHLEGFQVNALVEEDGILRVPTVFTREGVQNRGLKTRDELRKASIWMNYRPIIIGHPAPNTPVLGSKSAVGYTSDARFREEDGALVGVSNFWLEKTPSKIVEGIKVGQIREGSVGFYFDIQFGQGVFDGKPYDYIESNILFDHYAIVERGACSAAEGCGFHVNQEDKEEPKMTICKKKLTERVSDFIEGLLSGQNAPSQNSQGDPKEEAVKANVDTEPVKEEIDRTEASVEQAKKEAEEKLTAIQAEKEKLAQELKAYREKEAAELKAKHDALVAGITKVTKDDPKRYEGWSQEQLSTLKEKLGSVDRSLKGQGPADNEGKSVLTVGRWDPINKKWET